MKYKLLLTEKKLSSNCIVKRFLPPFTSSFFNLNSSVILLSAFTDRAKLTKSELAAYSTLIKGFSFLQGIIYISFFPLE